MQDNRDFNDHSDREPQWRPRRDHGNNDRRGNRRFDDNQGGRDGGRRFDRDDRRGGRRFDNDRRDDRGGRRFDNDRRDDRGFGGRRFDREDRRGGRRFDNERRDDRGFGGRKFDRDDRSERRFDNERRDDRGFGGRKFDRDDRSERRFDNERRDDRGFGGRRFDRDDRRGGRRFDNDRRDDRGGRRFDNDRGGRRFDRNDRGFGSRKFDRDDRNDNRKFRGNEPEIPERVKASDLDPDALRALQSLGVEAADKVARHLVMAGSLLDVDPEAAYEHANAAVARAGRIDVVREAAALAAYCCGKYAEALREVRAARRISGLENLRAIEADCERGLGRPEKAIEIFENTNLSDLELSEQAELIIVASGARADMGESEAGLMLVDNALSHNLEDEEIVARLMSVKADRLRELGRDEEADEVEAQMPAIPAPVSIIDLEEVAQAETAYYHSDLKGSRNPLSASHDVVLVDMDGVCVLGNDLIEYANTALTEAVEKGAKLCFVTNNAIRTTEAVSELLNGHGVPATPDQIMTSAVEGAAILSERIPPKAKVLVVGGAGLFESVAAAGFEIVSKASDRPAAVIQGLDKENVTWEAMSQAAIAISNGALFVATNLDKTLPVPDGKALGNGSMVAAVEHATGVRPIAGGKPFPGIYRRAQEMSGAEHPISVGDRLDTDIAGARKAGIPSLHVLTGVNGARDIALAAREERPDFLGLDLNDLNTPHPGPVMNPSGDWTCGESHGVHVESGVLYIEGQEMPDDHATITLDDYRALVAAVWNVIDEGDYVEVPQLTVVRDLESADFPLEIKNLEEDETEAEEASELVEDESELPVVDEEASEEKTEESGEDE